MRALRQTLWFLTVLMIVTSSAFAQTPLRLVNVTPCRLVDTRSQNNGAGFQGTMVFNLPQLAENGGNMGQCSPFSLSTALAYSLNVTLVPVHGQPVGYLTIWPTGEPQPNVSLLNSDGRIKANAAIVPSGTSGEVSVYVTNTTNVLIDIDAYFASPAAAPSALAFFPVTPCRIVDTRNGQDGGTLQAGQERDYAIPGSCGIPSDAAAYSFNVTVLPTQGELDYLTVWPKGEAMPVVSTLNDGTGTIVANAAIVPAGGDNATAFYPHDHNTDLLLDVNGYFAPPSSGSNPLSLYPVTPCRLLDTRGGIGLFNGTIPVGVVGGACGIPAASPEAFTFNATVVPDGDLLFLSLWPQGLTQPTVSTLNANDGAITSNMAIVPAGTGNNSIDAYAPTNTQLILDIASYFAPIAALTVQTSFLPNGTQNVNYSAPLTANGGVAPYTWTITSGQLPGGLNLSSSGTISGTPTGTGNSSFTVKATDSNSPADTATMNLSITVGANAGTPSITTTSLPTGTVSTPYSTLLVANGGYTPYTWSISQGTLPSGLTLNASSGQIGGVPGSAGLSNLTVKVTDAQNQTATQNLVLTIFTGDANATLDGMYAGWFVGFDDGNFYVAAFSITANGNGTLTAGEFDYNSSIGPIHATLTSGSYTIGSNGLGQISWTDSAGAGMQVLVATGAAEQMRVIGFNQNGSSGRWGAGTIYQQNPTDFNLNTLAGNWAFGFDGKDASADPIAADGVLTITSSGSVSGTEDINDFGTVGQHSFTGNVTSSIDANGRATAQYDVEGIGTIHEAVYAIDANQSVAIGIDAGGGEYFTQSMRQSAGPFNLGSLNGTAVGYGSRIHDAGQDNQANQAVVLLGEAGGNGNIGFLVDTNTGGSVGLNAGESGTYTVASNSRTLVTLTNGDTLTCYLVQTNQGFCLNTGGGGHDVMGAGLYPLEPQEVPSGGFNNASLSGEYLGSSWMQFLVSTGIYTQVESNVADGDGNLDSTYSQSGPGGTNMNQTLSGTYSVSSTGAFTISQNGSTVYAGFMISPNKIAYISAASGSIPVSLYDVTSSAPRHH